MIEAAYYFHNDHLGTPQVITNGLGQLVWRADYRPFGEANILFEGVQNNLRFPGQYFDAETGLHYNYFRDYHPGVGRYIEPDPIGLERQLDEFRALNSYVYALNSPINLKDVNGLKEILGEVPNLLLEEIPKWMLNYLHKITYASVAGVLCAAESCKRNYRPRQEAYIICMEIFDQQRWPHAAPFQPSGQNFFECSKICVKITESDEFERKCKCD